MKCETLDIWKRSCRLSVNIYKHFQNCIAEGMEKESTKDSVRYLDMAGGSTAELTTQVYIGIEIGYIPKAMGLEWVKELNELLKMLKSLKFSLKGNS